VCAARGSGVRSPPPPCSASGQFVAACLPSVAAEAQALSSTCQPHPEFLMNPSLVPAVMFLCCAGALERTQHKTAFSVSCCRLAGMQKPTTSCDTDTTWGWGQIQDGGTGTRSELQDRPLQYHAIFLRPCLLPKFSPKFYYAKRKFPITSKYRHIYIKY
jgi:hypothetical protein